MTFVEYLRRRPRGYTEAAYELRQALVGLPPTAQTRTEVYAWLRESGASRSVQARARIAANSYQDFMSGRNRRR